MNQKLGRASVRLERPVYILNSASVVGTKGGRLPGFIGALLQDIIDGGDVLLPLFPAVPDGLQGLLHDVEKKCVEVTLPFRAVAQRLN